jgi:glycosyltransferase involved in cell wall biosynthesis
LSATDENRSSDPMHGVAIDLLLETGGGGSGRHVLDLYAGLRAFGTEVHLLLSRGRMEPAFEAEVVALPSADVTFLDLRRSPHPSDMFALTVLRRRARLEKGVRILHAHSTKAGILGWGVGGVFAARVLTPHAYRGMDPTLQGIRAVGIRRAEAMFSRPFDAVIAVSEEEAGYALELGIAPPRIHFIPNGVDEQDIERRAAAARKRTRNKGPVIGFVGRLVPQKFPELFLDALGELARRGLRFNALIVGDGPLLPSLQVQAASLNIADRITWRGAAPALDELGSMDLLIHTSHYESLPYALLEAAAAGVPVVSVENAGSRSIFGGLFPESIVSEPTSAALATVAISVLDDAETRARYVDAAHRVAARFSVASMVRQTVRVYQEVLHGRRS